MLQMLWREQSAIFIVQICNRDWKGSEGVVLQKLNIEKLLQNNEGDSRNLGKPDPNEVRGLPVKKNLSYEHAVTVTEESVTVFYGFFVGGKDIFTAGKCAYKHNEGAFWCVEICEHLVNNLKFIPRIHEDAGAGSTCFYDAVFITG